MRGEVADVVTLFERLARALHVAWQLAKALEYAHQATDENGEYAEYVYDATGNILEIRRGTLDALDIISFTPTRGAPRVAAFSKHLMVRWICRPLCL